MKANQLVNDYNIELDLTNGEIIMIFLKKNHS
jgi:hypothetical protein